MDLKKDDKKVDRAPKHRFKAVEFSVIRRSLIFIPDEIVGCAKIYELPEKIKWHVLATHQAVNRVH